MKSSYSYVDNCLAFYLHFAIVFSVPLQTTVSGYPFGILRLILHISVFNRSAFVLLEKLPLNTEHFKVAAT
jgi:hypothetical protein